MIAVHILGIGSRIDYNGRHWVVTGFDKGVSEGFVLMEDENRPGSITTLAFSVFERLLDAAQRREPKTGFALKE